MKTSIAQRLTIWEGLLAIVGIALSIISIVGYMIPSPMILLLALASTILLLVLSIFVIVVNTITKSKSQDAESLIKELEEYTNDGEKDS